MAKVRTEGAGFATTNARRENGRRKFSSSTRSKVYLNTFYLNTQISVDPSG